MPNRNLLKALCFVCLVAMLPARAETGVPKEDPDPGRIAFLLDVTPQKAKQKPR